MRHFAAVAKQLQEKDYYSILNIPTHATSEEIKDAYRALAKKHHPDVRSTGGDTFNYDPDVEKFRDVVEAYQVLSVKESRSAFDLSRKKNPHLYQAYSQEQVDMMFARDNRDKRGVSPKTRPQRGSYAEQRIQELKKEREKFNVNDLGFYNGGVPRANRGTVRGKALGPAGEFHSPKIHNYKEYNHVDSFRVGTEDALKFKHYMGTDKNDFERTMPGYPMYYDTDHNYRKDRDFWLKMLLGIAFTSYAFKKWQVETDRARMTARMEGYKNIPGHHFHNRGGVIVLKDFVGFEKYYQNGDDMMAWYKKVYPKNFEGK